MVTKSAQLVVAGGGRRPAGRRTARPGSRMALGSSASLWPSDGRADGRTAAAAGRAARLAHGARLLRLSRQADGRTDGFP